MLSVLPVGSLCSPGPKAVTVVNTGDMAYSGTGDATVSLRIGDDVRPVPVGAVAANGGTWSGTIEYPNIPGGDWTIALQLNNQAPITQSCIG